MHYVYINHHAYQGMSEGMSARSQVLQDLREADSERQQLQEQIAASNKQHEVEVYTLQMTVAKLQVCLFSKRKLSAPATLPYCLYVTSIRAMCTLIYT